MYAIDERASTFSHTKSIINEISFSLSFFILLSNFIHFTFKTTTPAKTAKHPSTTPAKHSSTTPNKLSSTTPAKSVQRSILNKATPAKIGAQLTQVSDYANGLVSKKKPKPAHNDTLSLSSSSESENDDGLTVSDKPAKPKANEAFSSSLADIELNILRKKYDELNELNEQQKKEILKLKEEKAVLVTRNDALSSTYSKLVILFIYPFIQIKFKLNVFN